MKTTFKVFLESDQTLSYEDMVKQIKKDCGPWLNASRETQTKFVYRGVGNQAQLVAPKDSLDALTIRTDRKPRDTSKKSHEIINDFLLKEFDHPYRTASLFVTPSLGQAAGYTWNKATKVDGKVCLVFPIGHFDFVFSMTKPDVSWWLDGPGGYISDWLSDNRDKYDSDEDAKIQLFKDMEKLVEKNDVIQYVKNINLDIAYKKRREIMIKCDKYYLIPLSDDLGKPDLIHFNGYDTQDLGYELYDNF